MIRVGRGYTQHARCGRKNTIGVLDGQVSPESLMLGLIVSYAWYKSRRREAAAAAPDLVFGVLPLAWRRRVNIIHCHTQDAQRRCGSSPSTVGIVPLRYAIFLRSITGNRNAYETFNGISQLSARRANTETQSMCKNRYAPHETYERSRCLQHRLLLRSPVHIQTNCVPDIAYFP